MVNIAPQKNGDDLGMFIPLAYHMDPYELDATWLGGACINVHVNLHMK